MKNHRLIRIPYDRYVEGMNLQKSFYRKEGIKVPLWKWVFYNEQKKKNTDFDIEKFFGGFK